MKPEFNFSQAFIKLIIIRCVTHLSLCPIHPHCSKHFEFRQSHKFYLLFTSHHPLFYTSHHTLFHLGHDSNIDPIYLQENSKER